MADRDVLIENFEKAALAVMQKGLAGLSLEKAIIVDRAQKAGSDVVLVFSPGNQTIIGALHFPDPDADPAELFRIEIPSEFSN